MRIHEKYPRLTAAVRKTHLDNGNSFHAHDFDHALRVALMAERIADDPEVGRLAAIAGLCHNADRILQKMRGLAPNESVDDESVIDMVLRWLSAEEVSVAAFSAADVQLVIDAVLHHGNRNGENDSPVLIALMDADRIINMSADWILRNVQYLISLPIPVVDPVHLMDTPGQTFRKPGSILSSMRLTVEDWVVPGGFVGIRLPKARAIALERITFVRYFIAEVLSQRADEGLVPYPA